MNSPTNKSILDGIAELLVVMQECRDLLKSIAEEDDKKKK